MGTGCWYSGLPVPHCSCSTHHSDLKKLMTPCQLLQKQAWRRDQCVLACLPCSFVSHRAAYTQAISSRRSGVAAVSMSGTVLGRRVSLRVWSRTQITLALRDCIVLISVNAILGLLKRSTCVRGRTHSVICRYLPVWRRATIARSAIVAVARIIIIISVYACYIILLPVQVGPHSLCRWMLHKPTSNAKMYGATN